ncbi:MAG: BACON domain-containing protein [Bacteroidales bacterium]|nr:BACON domain-containing protein [Bacteroidales bacterium]
MKLKNLFWGALASLAVFAACEEPEQNLGTPDIAISATELTFDAAGGNQTLTVTATRDWMVETDADWVVVSPESGSASSEAQTVTVSVLENTGLDREASLKFTIGMKSKYLTVAQAGPGGSAEALIVYSNDYDKEVAEKTYGSGSSWPYLDQFDGWMNATGTGSANVEYAYSGMSARANSTSNSNYSDYAGSGNNNMFFGKSAYLATKNIALGGAKDFSLTFGTEKYSQDNGRVFTKSEFHIFLSKDGNKWVELTDYSFAGEGTEGRWNLASVDFSVPAGTESLSICMKVDVASSYRMDDLKLVIADKAGTSVDFSNAVEMDFTAGGNTGGGSTTKPESKGKKTVAEFIAAADNANYYELTGKVSGFNPTYCSFDLTDASGKIYVYSVLDASKSEWTSKISNGGTITIYGKYLYYEQKSQHEVVDAYIVSFTADGGSTGGGENEGKPASLVKATVAEFLAAAEDDTWYELTGEIISIAKEDYGNFTIKDATGEVYIYGMTNGWVGYNDKSFSKIGLKVGDTVTLGSLRTSYQGTPQGGGNAVPAYYISHVPGEGGGETPAPPAGEAGQYEPQGVTWTLGEKAYDNTSGTNAQVGTVNGEQVNNMLKLGTGSLTGDATLHVAAGTKKLGFYCVAWKNKKAQVKFSVGGSEIATIEPKANPGATGNPPYASINVTTSDYYEVELPSGTTDIKVETLDPANGRVIFIGLKAITE